MKRRCRALIVIFCLFAIWQAICEAGLVSPLLLPSPQAIGSWLLSAARDGSLEEAALVTLLRLVQGYLPGLALGLALGALAYSSRLAGDTLGLVALGFQALPSVCWTPLALLWFGQSAAAMRFVVIMGSVWSILMATRNALSLVPSLWVNAARVMGTDRLHLWTDVMLPAALPGLVSGARLGWAFAWRSLMAAEIYVTILDRMGLGQLLHYGRELQAMDQAMGVMLTIIVLGIIADKLLFLPIEHHLHKNWGI